MHLSRLAALAAVCLALPFAGCTPQQQAAINAGVALAPELAVVACTALTKQASHAAKCLSTSGAVITFGQALAGAQ